MWQILRCYVEKQFLGSLESLRHANEASREPLHRLHGICTVRRSAAAPPPHMSLLVIIRNNN